MSNNNDNLHYLLFEENNPSSTSSTSNSYAQSIFNISNNIGNIQIQKLRQNDRIKLEDLCNKRLQYQLKRIKRKEPTGKKFKSRNHYTSYMNFLVDIIVKLENRLYPIPMTSSRTLTVLLYDRQNNVEKELKNNFSLENIDNSMFIVTENEVSTWINENRYIYEYYQSFFDAIIKFFKNGLYYKDIIQILYYIRHIILKYEVPKKYPTYILPKAPTGRISLGKKSG